MKAYNVTHMTSYLHYLLIKFFRRKMYVCLVRNFSFNYDDLMNGNYRTLCSRQLFFCQVASAPAIFNKNPSDLYNE